MLPTNLASCSSVKNPNFINEFAKDSLLFRAFVSAVFKLPLVTRSSLTRSSFRRVRILRLKFSPLSKNPLVMIVPFLGIRSSGTILELLYSLSKYFFARAINVSISNGFVTYSSAPTSSPILISSPCALAVSMIMGMCLYSKSNLRSLAIL